MQIDRVEAILISFEKLRLDKLGINWFDDELMMYGLKGNLQFMIYILPFGQPNSFVPGPPDSGLLKPSSYTEIVLLLALSSASGAFI